MPMRQTTEIKIEQVILHHLPRDQATPRLSQVPIPAGSDPRTFSTSAESPSSAIARLGAEPGGAAP